MKTQELTLNGEFMKNGRDTIDYMNLMIQNLQILLGENHNYNHEVSAELEHLSQSMHKNVNKLNEMIYQFGDI